MRTVFFDVDTQIDFLFPAGALYVPGAGTILPSLSALNRHAASRGHVVVSTMDAHTEDDPEFKLYPHHCVIETTGQRKPASTLLEKRVSIPNAPCDVTLDGAQQILIEKQTIDCFNTLHLASILASLAADRYVVYGVAAEICVKLAAFGLLKTGRRVEIVADATRSLSAADSAKMLDDFRASGGVLTTVAEAISV